MLHKQMDNQLVRVKRHVDNRYIKNCMLMITRKIKNKELAAKNKEQNVFHMLLPSLSFY